MCRSEQSWCETQGKPLFKGAQGCCPVEAGRWLRMPASQKRARPRWHGLARLSPHSAPSAQPAVVPVGLPDGPATLPAVVLMPCSCSWPDLAGPVGYAIFVTSAPLPCQMFRDSTPHPAQHTHTVLLASAALFCLFMRHKCA